MTSYLEQAGTEEAIKIHAIELDEEYSSETVAKRLVARVAPFIAKHYEDKGRKAAEEDRRIDAFDAKVVVPELQEKLAEAEKWEGLAKEIAQEHMASIDRLQAKLQTINGEIGIAPTDPTLVNIREVIEEVESCAPDETEER